jgi:hypothetical protein
MSVICPECQKEVGRGTQINANAHAVDHWAGLDDAILSKEGRVRRNVLLKEAEEEN